ncbi:MAG: hypothetical protein R3B51_13265 [Thermodesulfobacteriota bacterium]
MIEKILLLLPFLLAAGCSRPSVYIPESYRTKRPSEAETNSQETESAIVTSGKSEEYTNFNAPYDKGLDGGSRKRRDTQMALSSTRQRA